MAELTTHILDTAHGTPAAGVRVLLSAAGDAARPLAVAETDSNGRAKLLPVSGAAFETGNYDLVFSIGAYFAAKGLAEPAPRFLDEVVIRFGLRADVTHYHVPLLISPFGYTVYRGQ
jgi:5-hydroxyisourate hydrolase